ncbi:MAG TPA: hypothetical protein VJP40_08715 [bacterium]|nr:hypothetical protein [bacterium]
MNQHQATATELEPEEGVSPSDRAIFAAIAVFIYEENKDFTAETPSAILPSAMNPWKLLARRESVG